MWAKIVKFYSRKTVYVPVALEAELPIVGNTEDHILAVKALEHNPGFQYLVRKFRHQQAALKMHLLRDPHKGMMQVIRLQEGIRWAGWFEDQLNRALAWKKPQAELPMDSLQQ